MRLRYVSRQVVVRLKRTSKTLVREGDSGVRLSRSRLLRPRFARRGRETSGPERYRDRRQRKDDDPSLRHVERDDSIFPRDTKRTQAHHDRASEEKTTIRDHSLFTSPVVKRLSKATSPGWAYVPAPERVPSPAAGARPAS